MVRLPVISAALILESVGLEVFRDQFGMAQCLSRGIGPRRKKLGPIAEDPHAFVFAPGDPPFDAASVCASELARDEARQILAGMCRICPFKHCKMHTWGMG